MIQVGIIGTGFMAAQHIKAYRQVPGVRVAALCNPSGRNLDGDFSRVAGNVGDADPLRLDMSEVKAFRDPGLMFSDPDISLVDICTPTRTHLDLSIAALAVGKHVLVEKPLARTHSEALRIAEVAETAAARGVFLMPALCIRFWPEYEWIRGRIRSGDFGKVLDARFRRVASAPAWGHAHFLNGGDSGGALLDLHIHDLDFIQYCFGRPRGIFASGYSKVSGAIDHVVALLQYPGGPVVSAEGSWGMAGGFPFTMAFTVNFERATVDFDLSRGDQRLRVSQDGKSQTVTLDRPDGYVGEIRHLVEAIQSKRPPTVVTAHDAAAVLELCEAEERSIHEGRIVTLD